MVEEEIVEFQKKNLDDMVRQRNKTKNNGELFIIECIVDRRRIDGKLQYLVKWKDYPSSHNTWEDASNIAHCREILADFREHRIQEGYDDSEDDTPIPPPPTIKKRKTTRKRKVEPEVEIITETNETPEMTPESVESTSKKTCLESPENDDSNSSQTSNVQMVNLSTASSIIAATYTEMGKYFCVQFLNESKYWISNEECRKYLPQLLLDFYENCSIYMEPGNSTGNILNNLTTDSGIQFDDDEDDENSQQNDEHDDENDYSVLSNHDQLSENDSHDRSTIVMP